MPGSSAIASLAPIELIPNDGTSAGAQFYRLINP